MSILPISGSSSDSGPVVQQPSAQSSTQKQPAPLPGTGAQNPEDTVELTQTAQIQQMAQLGEGASEIASSTGLSISVVDSDLGISTSSSVPVATPGGHGGGPSPAAGHEAASPSAASNAAPTTTSSPTLSVSA
ncbi:MAG TPA: hypothetical protein VMR02_14850 [Terracidiphilus sp.]|jgi:hypothetical protein|nr:hypothetical protein [Terracidiphilus sp.]